MPELPRPQLVAPRKFAKTEPRDDTPHHVVDVTQR